MSDAPNEPTPEAKPKKPLLPPSRIAVLIFVIVAAVVIVIELRARRAFQASYQAIDQAMADANETGKAVYRDDLGRYLSGSPKRETNAAGEVFTWRGVLQSYRIRLEYGAGGFVKEIKTE
jgi:hypothetical protein